MEMGLERVVERVTGRKLARKLAAATTPRKCRKARGMQYGRRLAIGAGAIGSGILALSVVHCTESVQRLTGSHWALAGLLAVGIDAGMVVSELAEVAAAGVKGCDWIRWARGYCIATVALSVLLNGYAFSQHAADGMQWAGWALGAVVPVLVYALGKVACGLWLAGE